MELKDYLKIIKRRWKEMLVILFLVVFFHIIYIQNTQVPQYSASTELVIKRTPSELGVVTQEDIPFLIISPEQRIDMITSENVMRRATEKVNQNFGLKLSPQTLKNMIYVKQGKNKYSATITVTSERQEISIFSSNAVAEIYIEEESKERKQLFDDALSYLSEQLSLSKADLNNSHKELNNYLDTLKSKDIWAPEMQLQEMFNRLTFFEKKIFNAQLERNKLQSQTTNQNVINKSENESNSKNELKPLDEDFTYMDINTNNIKENKTEKHISNIGLNTTSQTSSSIGQKIINLEIELAGLKKRYTAKHYKVVEKEAELSALKQLLKDLTLNSSQPINENDLKSVSARLLEYEEYFYQNEKDKIVQKMPTLQKTIEKYESLQREIISKEEVFKNLVAKKNDLSLKSQIDPYKKRVEITRRASLQNIKAISGKGLSSIWMAIILGIFLGITGGYIIEYLKNTISNPSDVKTYMNLPTIATIPMFKKESPFLIDVAVKSPVFEIYNKLAIFIESLSLEHKAKTFLITSGKPGEGKSTVSANTGIAMAQSGEKVLIVDADLRKPHIHMVFGLDNSRGVSTILGGELELEHTLKNVQVNKNSNSQINNLQSIIQPTTIDSLFVLPAGPIPVNPVGMLKSEKMISLVNELKNVADIIIFDSSPVIGVVDAAVLASMLDITLIITAENHITRKEAAHIKHTFNQVGGNIAGVILNKHTYETEEYYYYSHYRDMYH